MTELNFEQDNAIDLDDLHEEWRKHPGIRKKYADEVSYLEDVMKKAHERLKVVRSRLIKEAKTNGNTSADLREAYYRDHQDHIDAKEENIEAEYNLSMAWNALKAFDDRKIALENEVKLWTNDYWAAPREKRMVESGKGIKTENNGKVEGKQRASLKQKARKRKA